MFATVGTKLYGIVDASSIANVYNYDKKIADDGYPYATITPTSGREQVMTTTQDTLTISYTISIYVRNKSISTAESTIRGLVDEVLQDLSADQYLTGTALRAEFDIEWGWLNDEQPVRVAQIKCNYLLLISI